MNVELGWAGIGVIIAVLVHAYHTVKWSSKITIQIESIGTSLNRLDKELEKRDNQIQAAWRKLDNYGERILKIESKLEG